MAPAGELRICTRGSAWDKLNTGAARGFCPRLFACIHMKPGTYCICGGAWLLSPTHSEDLLLLQGDIDKHHVGRCVVLAGCCHYTEFVLAAGLHCVS